MEITALELREIITRTKGRNPKVFLRDKKTDMVWEINEIHEVISSEGGDRDGGLMLCFEPE